MSGLRIVAFALIVLGVIALAYQGITYTKREKVLEVGPLTATKESKETIPLPPIVGGVAFGLPAVLMGFLLAYDGSTGMAVLLAVLLGLSSGAELQIAAYMSSRYLGMKNYGLLFGAIVGLLALALGIGPMIMGAVFDHFGSYRLAFIAGIPLSLTASLLLFSFGGEEVRLASRQAEPRPV